MATMLIEKHVRLWSDIHKKTKHFHTLNILFYVCPDYFSWTKTFCLLSWDMILLQNMMQYKILCVLRFPKTKGVYWYQPQKDAWLTDTQQKRSAWFSADNVLGDETLVISVFETNTVPIGKEGNKIYWVPLDSHNVIKGDKRIGLWCSCWWRDEKSWYHCCTNKTLSCPTLVLEKSNTRIPLQRYHTFLVLSPSLPL